MSSIILSVLSDHFSKAGSVARGLLEKANLLLGKGSAVEMLTSDGVVCDREYARVNSCYAWAALNNGSFITGFVESVNESVQLATECSPPFDQINLFRQSVQVANEAIHKSSFVSVLTHHALT